MTEFRQLAKWNISQYLPDSFSVFFLFNSKPNLLNAHVCFLPKIMYYSFKIPILPAFVHFYSQSFHHSRLRK